MNRSLYKVGTSKFEILTHGDLFFGIGAVNVGGYLVRSGRLPFRPESPVDARVTLREVVESNDELRLRLSSASSEIDMVIRPAADVFNGQEFTGFSYHYEYRSQTAAISTLTDSASWEFDGNIHEATVITSPESKATLLKDAKFRNEGFVFSQDEERANFNFQWKAWRVLLGIYERPEAIYNTTRRAAAQPELVCVDKHIFEETKTYTTAAKKILFCDAIGTLEEARALWSAVHEEVSARARSEAAV